MPVTAITTAPPLYKRRSQASTRLTWPASAHPIQGSPAHTKDAAILPAGAAASIQGKPSAPPPPSEISAFKRKSSSRRFSNSKETILSGQTSKKIGAQNVFAQRKIGCASKERGPVARARNLHNFICCKHDYNMLTGSSLPKDAGMVEKSRGLKLVAEGPAPDSEPQDRASSVSHFSSSSNPPADLTLMEDSTTALNPPVTRDSVRWSASISPKSTASPSRILRGERSAASSPRTSRAWSQNEPSHDILLVHGSAGHKSSRSTRKDDTWLQPLLSQPASGAYLPRRLFGFPSEYSGSFLRSSSVSAIPSTVRRTRIMSGIERSKLAPINEAEDSLISSTAEAKDAAGPRYILSSLTETGQLESLAPNADLSRPSRLPKFPQLFEPRIAYLGYGLVLAWAGLCLWTVLEEQASSSMAVGRGWILAVAAGFMQELLIHQNLRAIVTAAAIAL